MKKFAPAAFSLLLVAPLSIFAQNYAAVDEYVSGLGPMADKNVASIAQQITTAFPEKKEKARAIYYWIANNISVDPKASKGSDQRNSDPVKVIELRKATALGFSLLLQEMCSQANIRCLSVDGYTKIFPEEINDIPDEINHSWNVVQLGQSPEEWFYVDVAKAAGFLDKRQTFFTKKFTSEYFFADRVLFNLDHYPDNSAWQLGPGPKTLKDFYALPVMAATAYELGLQKPQPATGFIKAKTKAGIAFNIPYKSGTTVSTIELVMGDEKKQPKPVPMNFSASGGNISFSYQFKNEDEFPLRILANGKDLLSYKMEVSE